MEKFGDDSYKAQEHAVDADAADLIIDEPEDHYFNARHGMKEVVRLRRVHEGVTWIAGNPHRRLLLYALGDLVAQARRAPPIAELTFLLTNAEGWVRDQAWRAAQQHWDDSLSGFLMDELARSDLRDTSRRHRLVAIAAAHGGRGDPIPDLVAASRCVPFARRLELVYDLFATKLEDDPEGKEGAGTRRARADSLLQSFEEAERELALSLLDVLGGGEILAVANALSEPSRKLLETTLPSASIDLSGPLACLAAGVGLNIDKAAARLLATDDAVDGEAAIQAMLIANGAGLQMTLQQALTHKRYNVRRHVLRLLAADEPTVRRSALVRAAGDHSADVRVAFANLMEEYCWPEAIDALVQLLGDTRNFSSRPGMGSSWSKFSVARAAARALGAYEELPILAVDALLEAAQADGTDPFVACAAMSALANQDDPRIVPALLVTLKAPGLDHSPSYRPRAQAAAWALCDRATTGGSEMLVPDIVRIAEGDMPFVAGPLLIAIGVNLGPMREDLLKRLRASRQLDREALVRAAAIAGDAIAGLTLDDREQILWRLARGETVDSLDPTDRTSAVAWSQALNTDNGFQRFIAWIVEAVFKLPLNGEVGDIRAFHLPERVGVMTMRSLSPYREEDGGHVDDGT